jgi:hypothetical protein
MVAEGSEVAAMEGVKAVVRAEGTEEMGMEVVVMGEAEMVAGGLEVVGMEVAMAVMAVVG